MIVVGSDALGQKEGVGDKVTRFVATGFGTSGMELRRMTALAPASMGLFLTKPTSFRLLIGHWPSDVVDFACKASTPALDLRGHGGLCGTRC